MRFNQITIFHLQMRHTQPKYNQPVSALNSLTSVWYTMHQQLYLMHVQDLALKIDSKNAHLKNSLELYIDQAEQIEKNISKVKHPPLIIDQQKLQSYEKQITQIDVALKKQLNIMQENSKQIRETSALNRNLWSFIQAQSQIYNAAVGCFNTIYTQRHIFGNDIQQIEQQLLTLSEDQHQNSQKMIEIQQKIKNVKSIIYRRREEEQQTLKIKQEAVKTAINNIKNFYSSRSTVLPGLQNSLQTNIAHLNTLNQSKQYLQKLDRDLFQAKSNYDRLLASIIQLRNVIALTSRQDQNKKYKNRLWDQQIQEADSANNSQDEATPSDFQNKKIVFVKQQPSTVFRLFLLVWFALLTLVVIRLSA